MNLHADGPPRDPLRNLHPSLLGVVAALGMSPPQAINPRPKLASTLCLPPGPPAIAGSSHLSGEATSAIAAGTSTLSHLRGLHRDSLSKLSAVSTNLRKTEQQLPRVGHSYEHALSSAKWLRDTTAVAADAYGHKTPRGAYEVGERGGDTPRGAIGDLEKMVRLARLQEGACAALLRDLQRLQMYATLEASSTGFHA